MLLELWFLSWCLYGGSAWIRTMEGAMSSRFTVYPVWPLRYTTRKLEVRFELTWENKFSASLQGSSNRPLWDSSVFLLLIKYSAGFEPANYGFADHSRTNWVTVQHFFPWIRTTINGSKIRCPTIGRGRI